LCPVARESNDDAVIILNTSHALIARERTIPAEN
jgi:hypothetical protein